MTTKTILGEKPFFYILIADKIKNAGLLYNTKKKSETIPIKKKN